MFRVLLLLMLANGVAANYHREQLSGFDVIFHMFIVLIGMVCFLHPPVAFIGIGCTLNSLVRTYCSCAKLKFVHSAFLQRTAHKSAAWSIPIVLLMYLIILNEVYILPPWLAHQHIYIPLLFVSTFIWLSIVYHNRSMFCWKESYFFIEDDQAMRLINQEITSPDTHVFRISDTLNKYLYFTNHYFVYISNWGVRFCRRDDMRITVNAVVEPLIRSSDRINEVPQIIRLKIDFVQEYLDTLIVPVSSIYFRDMRDHARINIDIPENIHLAKSAVEQFIVLFRRLVAENEITPYEGEIVECFGCSINNANVRLVKSCHLEGRERAEGTPDCGDCQCRPMWCCSCMARIFLSKQDTEDVTSWVNGVSNCPTCRAHFCISDVHMLE
ncbi:unnamed protein product [Caenorhabditis bovis]|uniref:Transmembrane protein 129 n=1 Tax=Caenorhabditis bovis TaxID=2654633 RepID=A0A8S1EP76_9PELO|nr:unnamed protein product [Caenorhabditis bovis]